MRRSPYRTVCKWNTDKIRNFNVQVEQYCELKPLFKNLQRVIKPTAFFVPLYTANNCPTTYMTLTVPLNISFQQNILLYNISQKDIQSWIITQCLVSKDSYFHHGWALMSRVAITAFSCAKLLTLKVLNFWTFIETWSGWIFDSYCSLKPLCSGMGEVVPARTSPTLPPPSPRTVL